MGSTPRNLRCRRAACQPSAPRGNGATAPAKAGAPSSTPSPAQMTERCPRWDTRPHVPNLRYGVAQGWILDETTRGSVNIQEAVDRVAHTGQAEVALHTRGRHGGPAEAIIVEPSGMVLVLAADMVPGVLHASRVRRARPQWTIQVYTPPRAWPFSTWAVRAVMCTWHRRTPPQEPRRNSPGTSTPGQPARISPGTGHGVASQWHPRQRGSASRQPFSGTPSRGHATSCSRARSRPPRQTPSGDGTQGGAQPLPGPWVLPVWYLPMGTLAHAAETVKGAFPQPLLPVVALLRSLQAGAAWVRWREEGGRPSPYFPLVQGQALLHAEGMGTVEWGVIVPGTACRWITAAAPQPMLSLPACQRLLRAVPSLAAHHTLTRDVWRAMLSHTREWLTNPAARYPPGLVLEQLTAPTPRVRHALHRASALTEPLTDEVLDLALEPLRVLYRQTHIPPAGTFNRLGRLRLQRRVEVANPGGVVEQWLTHRNPSTAQGHWYLHQLLFLPRAAPEHRRRNPYHTHPKRLGAQSLPQPALPALSPGQGPEALQQGPPLDTTTRVQQRRSNGADGAEPDCTNCRGVAWTAACRHLARDTTGLRQYRPMDRTALSPWVPWRHGQRNCSPTSPAETRSPASQPQRTRRRHPSRRSSYTSSRRRCWQTAGRVSSTTTAQRRWREAYKGRSA